MGGTWCRDEADQQQGMPIPLRPVVPPMTPPYLSQWFPHDSLGLSGNPLAMGDEAMDVSAVIAYLALASRRMGKGLWRRRCVHDRDFCPATLIERLVASARTPGVIPINLQRTATRE